MVKKTTITSLSAISKILRAAPVLPGENAELYQSGLLATIEELEAKTPLQIYLAEKIFDCLWWIRRYEEQKRAMIVREMAGILKVPTNLDMELLEFRKLVFDEFYANEVSDNLIRVIEANRHSLNSLRELAITHCFGRLNELDELIALHAKTLAGFQGSYEVSANRKINRDRLILQNQILQRDLGAITHDNAKAAPGK